MRTHLFSNCPTTKGSDCWHYVASYLIIHAQYLFQLTWSKRLGGHSVFWDIAWSLFQKLFADASIMFSELRVNILIDHLQAGCIIEDEEYFNR
jgi:hypothetical protein